MTCFLHEGKACMHVRRRGPYRCLNENNVQETPSPNGELLFFRKVNLDDVRRVSPCVLVGHIVLEEKLSIAWRIKLLFNVTLMVKHMSSIGFTGNEKN